MMIEKTHAAWTSIIDDIPAIELVIMRCQWKFQAKSQANVAS